MRRPLLATAMTAVAMQVCAPCASAQAPASPAEPSAAEIIDELRQAIAVRDQVIRNLIQRIERVEQSIAALPAPPPGRSGEPPGDTAAATSGPAESSDTAGTPTAAELARARAEADAQLIRVAFERALIERGGVLLPQWRFEIEPSVSYAHSSSENLVIDGFTIFPVLVVGDIFSERVKRDTFTTTLSARLGLPLRSQLELRLPYVYEDESRLDGDGREMRKSDRGIGDLELAVSRQLRSAARGGPDLVGSLRWKMVTAEDPFGIDPDHIPFGNGFHTVSAALTAVEVLDPLVFFGGLTYTRSLDARKDGARIDPGDTVSLQLGAALALNLDTSVNFSFEQSFTGRTRLDGAKVPGTYVNTSTLAIGLSRALQAGLSFDASLAIGLAEDSPDLTLSFAAPLR